MQEANKMGDNQKILPSLSEKQDFSQIFSVLLQPLVCSIIMI